MRTRAGVTWRRASVLTVVLVALGLVVAALVITPRVQALEESDLGCPDHLVERKLANGAEWRLCVRIHPFQGLVLDNVEFRPATGEREYAGFKRILDSVHLAQLNVPYDTGGIVYNDITEYGFGGDHLVSQNADTCTGETRSVTYVTTVAGAPTERTVSGICLADVDTGLAFHSREWSVDAGPRFAEQGTALEISALSKVSWYEYQQRITLDDQGGIDVGLGATGDVAPGETGGIFFTTQPATGWPLGPAGDHSHATSHWHNAIYRVDFGIDAGTEQRVEQWDYAPGSPSAPGEPAPRLAGTPTLRGEAFAAHPTGEHARLTWWRVLNPDSLNRDGHPRSYEIVQDNPVDVEEELTSVPIAFTNAKPCQQYASDNLDPACPGLDVLDYVAGDDAPLTDPVAWVNVGFHHVDRDEDQSPMPTHWQHFQLRPRDFFAQGPATPDARSCINGPGYIDTPSRPCVATAETPPTVTASTTPVGVGTTLTATRGVWNERRTTWDYAYLWFRDGEPIKGVDEHGTPTAATDPTYVVTAADRGHALTVKVTASHPGYLSGTAESAPVRVPGPPPTGRPTPTSHPEHPDDHAGPATPTVSVASVTRVRARHRARLVVRVAAAPAAPTGRVVVRVRGKQVGSRLSSGRAVLRVPAIRKPGRYRMVVRYLGSATVAPAQRVVILRVLPRRR